MMYFCADDYGLCQTASRRIESGIEKGVLNKVSVFPNFDKIDFDKILKKDVLISLHLNLVEGKCMTDEKIPLLADENGFFRHTFGGLFKLNLFSKKEFEKQVYSEIKAQVLFWKSILPPETPFCIDSHQHTHMIPAVFRALTKVLKDENIDLLYMRIPVEPLSPYLKSPSLYFTYSAVNVIKQWLINFLWLFNKKHAIVDSAYFSGILFSGKMDRMRVRKILPYYEKLSLKNGKDVEILFHPGYLNEDTRFNHENIKFYNFYLSKNRKTEFDAVMNLSEGCDL